MTGQPSPKKVNRLTKKDVEDCATSVAATILSRTCGKTLTNQILRELLEYKSIEEQLGIDLVTFFKFLNAKVCYEKDPDDNEITKCLITGITKTGILNVQAAFPYGECEREARFIDYGKTWALTKEELAS